MDIHNRHAALAPLFAVIDDYKRYSVGCTSMSSSSLDILDSFRQKVERIVMSRGVEFLLEDLPQLGKVFDRCISDGRMPQDSLPL